MDRKYSVSIVMDRRLQDELDEYARRLFGGADVRRSRSAATRALLRRALADAKIEAVK